MSRPAGEARARILAVAESQLRTIGAAQITIEVVARDAGCAKGLVHYHYRTKEQLMAAAAAAMIGASERRWISALQASSPDAAIKQTWALLMAEVSEGVPLAWASLEAQKPEMTGQTVKNAFDRMSAVFAEGIGELLKRDGLVLRASTDEIGSLVAATVRGFEAQLAAGVSAESLEGAYAALWVGILALTRPASSPRDRPAWPRGRG